jgi:hypothetical protein
MRSPSALQQTVRTTIRTESSNFWKRTSTSGHLQPSSSIAFDVSLPSDTFRALGLSVTEALGQYQTQLRSAISNSPS